MSQMPGDMGSEILAARSRMQDMQRPGGIGGLLGRFRRPMFPPMGGFGGFGGGGFGPPPFNPMMYGGFPGMGGGFFGGFRPRFRRRPRPTMPDYSKQFSTLEAKIAELQKQLADRQAATPMPDPAMDVAEPRPPMRVGTMGGPGFGRYPLGTAGPEFLYDDAGNPILEPPGGLRTTLPIDGMGPGRLQIPNISDGRLDIAEIEERLANLNIPTPPAITIPPREILERGPGGGKIPMKPPSISRLPSDMLDAVDDRGVPIFGGRGDLMPPPTKLPRVPARLEPIKMQPLPLPGGERIDLPRIPDEILRDVQSRGTVGPGMVPPPVDKLPRMDPIKVPIKMPPVPMIPAPMPDPMPMPSMPAPIPSMPAPMPRLPRVGMAGPGPRIRR